MITQTRAMADNAGAGKTSPAKSKLGEAHVLGGIQDTVTLGEKKGVLLSIKDFLAKDMKPSDKSYEAYSSEDFMDAHETEVKGAMIGGALGAVIGGAVGYNDATGEIKSQPVNSVTLDWDKPVVKEAEIGRIPANHYEPARSFFFNQNPLIPVVRDVPVIGSDGKPEMQHVDRTWTDHGKPVVRWDDRNIQEPKMTGYSESRWEDSHTVSDRVGTDSNGNPIYSDRKVIDGWQVSYSPNIQYKTIGTYKEPGVTFETGVSVAMRTLGGILFGALGGALVGAFVASAIKKATNRE